MRRRADLDAAYRAARYAIIVHGRPHPTAIGRASPKLDVALRRCGCRSHWCLLTPCNPGSRRLTAGQNARRLLLLQRIMRRRGWRTLPAHNASADGRWHEPGWCLLDVAPQAVQPLARRFGQLAWVLGRLGAMPALVWTDQSRRSL